MSIWSNACFELGRIFGVLAASSALDLLGGQVRVLVFALAMDLDGISIGAPRFPFGRSGQSAGLALDT